MPYLTKPLKEIQMTNENNKLLDDMRSIEDSLEKLEQNSKKVSDQVGLTW